MKQKNSDNVKEVVVGDDFKFGYKGEGKALEISSLSNNLINTNIINLIMMDDEKIGSTKILQLLKEGKIETVNKLLGYNYYFNGSVVKGKQVGRRLGFPTANINNNNVKNLLKTGVYGVVVYVDDCSYLGMMNLGHNPTCNFTNELSLEINLFDVDNKLKSDKEILKSKKNKKFYSDIIKAAETKLKNAESKEQEKKALEQERILEDQMIKQEELKVEEMQIREEQERLRLEKKAEQERIREEKRQEK